MFGYCSPGWPYLHFVYWSLKFGHTNVGITGLPEEFILVADLFLVSIVGPGWSEVPGVKFMK